MELGGVEIISEKQIANFVQQCNQVILEWN